MAQRLTHFIYAHPDGPVTLQISEDDVTYYDMTLTATMTVEDALAEWTTQANAHVSLSNTYALTAPGSGAISLISTGTAYYKGPANLHKMLGFASETMGNGTNVPSDTTVLGLLDDSLSGFSGIGYALAEHSDEVKPYSFRLGRSMALAHSHAKTVRWSATMTTALYEAYATGPLFRGKLRIEHTSNASPYSDSNTSGYMDVFPFGELKVTPQGDADTYVTITGQGTLAEEADKAVPSAGSLEELTRGWSHGYGVIYAARIEGINFSNGNGFLFTEIPTGASMPSGWTELPGLIVDNSAKVGSLISRKDGLGAGFNLTLAFADAGATADATGPLRQSGLSAFVMRSLFKPPGAATRLVADLSHTETTEMLIDDGSGFTGSVAYIGKEAIKYATAGASASSYSSAFGAGFGSAAAGGGGDKVSTLTRGAPAGYWRQYDHSAQSSVGTYVTDTPQIWRGREVELYAIPVDPFGDVMGTDVMSDAIIIWRGHVASHPDRQRGVWQIACAPYERRLSDPIGAGISGSATWDFSSDELVTVNPSLTLVMTVGVVESATAGATDGSNFQPFSAYSAGDQILASKWRAVVAAACATEAAAYTWAGVTDPTVQSFAWRTAFTGNTPTYRLHMIWQPGVADQRAGCTFYNLGGGALPSGVSLYNYNGGSLLDMQSGVATQPDTTAYYSSPSDMLWDLGQADYVLRFVPDNGRTDDIPAAGFVILESEDERSVMAYDKRTIDNSGTGTALVNIEMTGGVPNISKYLGEGGAPEVSCEIAYSDSGAARDVLRRMLASSGRSGAFLNDATYDTGALRSGYDLAHIDHDSIGSRLGRGVWRYGMGFDQLLTGTDTSYAAVFGSLLALSSNALVTSWTGSDLQIRAVSTSLPDTGYYVADIGDSDLVTSGRGESVKVLENAFPRPNSVRVTVERVNDDAEFSITYNDTQSIDQHGLEQWQITTNGVSQVDMSAALAAWSGALIGFGMARPQLIEITVHPGTPGQPGDLVRLTLSHPYLWSWAPGAQGYTGPGRVIGSQLNLSNGLKTLTLMIDGAISTAALCPSEAILAWDDPATPAYVDIRADAYDQFRQWFDRDGSIELNAFLPGSDDEANRYTIDDVTEEAGPVCRLNISAQTGTFTVTTAWHVTVCETANATAATLDHAHTDTSGSWI